MRVGYLNELDGYVETHVVEARNIIEGVGLDLLIGIHYNNPSFDYAGYCPPKVTERLLANYEDVPSNLIRAIVETNSTRKDFIAEAIINRRTKVVGIYRLVMKTVSENIRSFFMQGVIKRLKAKGTDVMVYELLISQGTFFGSRVTKGYGVFMGSRDVITTNHKKPELDDVKDKVCTRDSFGADG